MESKNEIEKFVFVGGSELDCIRRRSQRRKSTG